MIIRDSSNSVDIFDLRGVTIAPQVKKRSSTSVDDGLIDKKT